MSAALGICGTPVLQASLSSNGAVTWDLGQREPLCQSQPLGLAMPTREVQGGKRVLSRA